MPNNIYSINGLNIVKSNLFKISYFDKPKKTFNNTHWINGGFFGKYAEQGKKFTLPVGNVCADISLETLCNPAQFYLKPYVSNNKLKLSCNQNFQSQMKQKLVSTLIVPKVGVPYVAEINTLPSNVLYAISGVPVVRAKVPTDYNDFVKPQGWDDSCMYGTFRNFIGLKNDEIWIISGRTSTYNYILKHEIWDKLKEIKFDDIICLDGGGSYFFRYNNIKRCTFENRQINNIIVF